MSVQEIIEQIGRLAPEDLALVRAAVADLSGVEAEDQARRRATEAMDRLMAGVCEGGGRHLSAGIDEALYGGTP